MNNDGVSDDSDKLLERLTLRLSVMKRDIIFAAKPI